MNRITADALFLKGLGLERRDVGAILGRTRQAIDSGFARCAVATPPCTYFKSHEFVSLLLQVRLEGRDIPPEAYDYIADMLGPDERDRIQRAMGQPGEDPLKERGWSEFWVILPDIRHLLREGQAGPAPKALLSLPAEHPRAAVTYVCPSQLERDILLDELQAYQVAVGGRVRVCEAIASASQMTCVIADPRTAARAAIFVPTAAGLQKLSFVDARMFVAAQQKIYGEVLEPQLQDA